jgi:hypothetical protein
MVTSLSGVYNMAKLHQRLWNNIRNEAHLADKELADEHR